MRSGSNIIELIVQSIKELTAPQVPTNPILTLPIELWVEVIKSLSPKDILSVSKTCKDLYTKMHAIILDRPNADLIHCLVWQEQEINKLNVVLKKFKEANTVTLFRNQDYIYLALIWSSILTVFLADVLFYDTYQNGKFKVSTPIAASVILFLNVAVFGGLLFMARVAAKDHRDLLEKPISDEQIKKLKDLLLNCGNSSYFQTHILQRLADNAGEWTDQPPLKSIIKHFEKSVKLLNSQLREDNETIRQNLFSLPDGLKLISNDAMRFWKNHSQMSNQKVSFKPQNDLQCVLSIKKTS